MFWKWSPINAHKLFDLKSKWRRFEDGVWSYVKDHLQWLLEIKMLFNLGNWKALWKRFECLCYMRMRLRIPSSNSPFFWIAIDAGIWIFNAIDGKFWIIIVIECDAMLWTCCRCTRAPPTLTNLSVLFVFRGFCRTRAFMVWHSCDGMGSGRLEDAVKTVHYNHIVWAELQIWSTIYITKSNGTPVSISLIYKPTHSW